MARRRHRGARAVLLPLAATALGGIVCYGAFVAVAGVPGLDEAREREVVTARAETRPTPSADGERDRAATRAKSAGPKRIARTVGEVIRTPFVPEYRKMQPEIAGPQFRNTYHPDADLAADGLDICRMIDDPDITLTEMIEDFTNNDHPHKGPVTPKAAMQTARQAIKHICPDLGDEFEGKAP